MPRRWPMPRENPPTRLVATPARPVISMTSLTREALMLWVAAMERRCSGRCGRGARRLPPAGRRPRVAGHGAAGRACR